MNTITPGAPTAPKLPTSSLPSLSAASGAGAAGGAAAATGTSALGNTATASDQQNNFLKMLVAQMKNQDPLNPMDNAQVTSQLAQISTVQGIEKLNTNFGGMNTQFAQLQTLQGAALVGKDVAVEGHSLRVDAGTGKGDAGYELGMAATDVQVEVTNAAGQTVGKLDLGAQDAGPHTFDIAIPEANRGQALTFKVAAVDKSTPVDTKSLSYNQVSAVSTVDGKLAIELDNGQRVPYDAVAAFL